MGLTTDDLRAMGIKRPEPLRPVEDAATAFFAHWDEDDADGVSREDWTTIFRPTEYEVFVRLMGILRRYGWDTSYIQRRQRLAEYLQFVDAVEALMAYYIRHEPKATPREHILATAHRMNVMDTDIEMALIAGDARRGYRTA